MFHFNFKSARGANYKKYGKYVEDDGLFLGHNGNVCSVALNICLYDVTAFNEYRKFRQDMR